MSTRRVLSVYADDTRVNRQDVSGPTTIRQLKGQVKDGLKKKLGMTHSIPPPKITMISNFQVFNRLF